MRLLVASDVHGYGKLLARLLEQVAYRPGEDRLFLLGDYIDRGPDARGTLELVMKLVEGGPWPCAATTKTCFSTPPEGM